MAVTIKDIARDTGLSLSTISKYLNNGKVREGNRAKFERSIAKFDFRPNEIARGLRSAKTRTVGVLVPSFRSVFSAEVVVRLEEELAASGLRRVRRGRGRNKGIRARKTGFSRP